MHQKCNKWRIGIYLGELPAHLVYFIVFLVSDFVIKARLLSYLHFGPSFLNFSISYNMENTIESNFHSWNTPVGTDYKPWNTVGLERPRLCSASWGISQLNFVRWILFVLLATRKVYRHLTTLRTEGLWLESRMWMLSNSRGIHNFTLTGSEKAQSQMMVAKALLSWLPWTMTTTGSEIIYNDDIILRSCDHVAVSPSVIMLFPFKNSI